MNLKSKIVQKMEGFDDKVLEIAIFADQGKGTECGKLFVELRKTYKEDVESLIKESLNEVLVEIEEFIDENTNGLEIENIAKKFQVPDSVMAIRLLSIKLESIKLNIKEFIK